MCIKFEKSEQMKNMMIMVVASIFTSCAYVTAAGEVKVTGVEAHQRYPWNGIVDITVVMQGASNDVASVDCLFVATNNATKTAIPVMHIVRKGNDTVLNGEWRRQFVWDAKAEVGAVKVDDVTLTVGANFVCNCGKTGHIGRHVI